MSKRIVFKNPDGTVGVITPSPKWQGTMNQLAAKDVPAGAEFKVVEEGDLPARELRSAWRLENNVMTVNMPAAREAHMNRIRAARDAELVRLDIEQLKGVDVSQQKQVLRDIPQQFDLSSATTPEELIALWPTELQSSQ